MADEEFDDIDWGQAIALDPTKQMGVTADNDNSVMNQTHSFMPDRSMIQQQPPQQTMTASSAAISSTNDMEALRNQIQHLQNELLSKDEKINDLQNTAATTQIESSHRIKAAEEEAQRKIHLVQEELRRVKMEADKYKGSWVRSKKRVTELESNQSAGNNNGTTRTTNRVSHDNNNKNLETNAVNLSAFGFPTDIETRRVTPSNLFGNNHSENHAGHECAPTTNNNTTMAAGHQIYETNTTTAIVSGSKRKMMEQPLLAGGADLTTALPRSLISQTMFQYESLTKHDTVVQRLARHLIMRDEMGCYSLTPMELSLFDVTSENDGVKPNNDIMQQSLAKGEETRSYIRSILHQIIDTDGVASDLSGSGGKQISSSGLFFILLARLNSTFSNIQKVDDDNNHSMEDNPTIACGSVPSISVLHILRVMCDILLLSAKTRDDLRFWLYQSQQPLGSAHEQKSFGVGSSSSFSSVHSRIEGLSSNQIKHVSSDSKEALWTSNCRATLVERGNEWDPMTMSQPCSAFFGILVALMKGSAYCSNPFDLESKGTMKLMLREQATRLVLTLMSDAPHYRVESVGKTPYLWKYWFDSLFQTSTLNEVDAENMTGQVEDFFSLWEVSNRRGSGRKCCIQPISQEVPKSNKQKRSNTNGTIHSYKRDATSEQDENLSVKVKCGIIQLLSLFVVSSSSVHEAIYEPTGPQSLPLARRVLAAILDEVDDCIIPSISPYTKVQTQVALNYLQLCLSCNEFILALARSNEGIHMLRYQMRIESGTDEQISWSYSAISCMALILNSVLSCAISMEREEITPKWPADLTPYLNRIAEQCITFFKTLQSFARNQKRNSSKSKSPTFASLISEQHLVLLSCFQKLSTREQEADAESGTCLLWIRDELKYDVQVMIEEALYDE